ncbi:MAG: phosphoenolpyruvate--protein phosphotransferase [Sedimentisphaerales bacterium]|nr:phosphoenolpyruvate--protein phosphotransferase [Sedimentisphaerales bacterium]
MSGKPTMDGKVRADVLSPGVLAGQLHFFEARLGSSQRQSAPVEDPDAEIERFEKQVDAVVKELEGTASSLRETSFDAEADIVQAHVYLLTDGQFHQGVHNLIRNRGLSAQKAAAEVLHQVMAKLDEAASWLSERTADFRDILSRLEAKLSEREGAFIASVEHVHCPIIAAGELLPSLVLEARRLRKCAFIVEKGTATSHAAILAKSFGFPAVRVESLDRLHVESGEDVLVDAIQGYVIANPNDREVNEVLQAVRRAPAAKRPSALVRLSINITDPLQVSPDVLLRVEGIGLYRTEVLFMASKRDFPSEDEQYREYRRLFEICKETSVTFRTADIGGDKMLPYFSLGPQENPYLGLRAHRIYRFHPEIFVTQVRAVLRAARGQPQLRLMYPMIEDIEELRFVQSLVWRAADSLKRDSADYQDTFQQGIMVEVPSAAWNLDALLQRVDFASAGTNDLLQYFLAADRNNSNIAASYRASSPAFLKMLKALVAAADRQGKPLSLCGEIAANRAFLPLLIGIGFKDISVEVHVLDAVEETLSTLKQAECEELAETCLRCRTSEEVRVILRESGHEETPAQQCPVVAADEAIDPVCKMVVHAGRDSYTYDRHDRRYYFCSTRCREEFVHNVGDKP